MIWATINRIVCGIWGHERVTADDDVCIWCNRPLEKK